MPKWDEPGVRYDDPLIHWDDPRTYQQILEDQNQTPHPMPFEVALDISRLGVPALIQRARAFITAAGELDELDPMAADVTLLGTYVSALETGQSEIDAAKALAASKTIERDETLLPPVFEQFKVCAKRVGELAPSEAVVEASTLRGTPKPGPKPVPDRPTGLELAIGDEDGEISGQCNGQPGIVDYHEIRFTTTDPNSATPNWQFADTSTKSSFELKGMPSGAKVWVSFRAVNARGKSPWSDPACIRVP